MSTTQTTTNKQFTLNIKDAARGLLIAVITAVLTALLSMLQAGGLEAVDWKGIGIIGLTAGVAYLVKNYFTPSEIVIQNPSPTDLKAVKEGEAQVEVKKTS